MSEKGAPWILLVRWMELCGEEGATPRKRGQPSGGEEATKGDWVTVGTARRRWGHSPSLLSLQQSRHVQAQVMPAIVARDSHVGCPPGLPVFGHQQIWSMRLYRFPFVLFRLPP